MNRTSKILLSIIFFIQVISINASSIKIEEKLLNKMDNNEKSKYLINLIFEHKNRLLSSKAIKILYSLQSKNKTLPILTSEKLIDPKHPRYFSLYILDIYTIKPKGTLVTGIVSSGTLKIGDKIIIKKANGKNLNTECTDIEFFKSKNQKVYPGQTIGIFLKNITHINLEQGDMVFHEAPTALKTN